MASVQEIRQRLRGQRIEVLRSSIEPLLAGKAGSEVWLFGSLARGDWDARSDVDLLAVAPDQSAADQLAEDLLGAGLADDVIGLSQGRWLERRQGDDPWWRGICRDAIRLQPGCRKGTQGRAAGPRSGAGRGSLDCGVVSNRERIAVAEADGGVVIPMFWSLQATTEKGVLDEL